MHDIQLKPRTNANGSIIANAPLELAGTVKTYRYLDEEEIEKIEEAKAGEEKKK